MSKYLVTAPCLLTFLCPMTFASPDGEQPASNIGKAIPNFTAPDTRGQATAFASFQDKKAFVVIFTGTECVINNAYLPRLAELCKTYAPRGVQFLAINSNQQDDAARVAQHAREYEIPFPVVKDKGNRIADLFAAQRTPEAFVLDAQRRIRYRGRIDDQIGIGYRRALPTRDDLAVALDEVLAGNTVAQPVTPVAGCFIAREAKPKADAQVTFTRDVARVMQQHCQECHRPGQIAPMALLTHGDVSAWAETIREVVTEKRMPPWYADEHFGKFANNRSLPEADRKTLLAWIEQGCPKGDDKDMPPAREFYPGWTIGKPDAVFSVKEQDTFEVPAVGPKNGIEYQYFEVETGFTEDRWVERAEARPGASSVVHHIIVFVVPPGRKFIPRQGNGEVLCGTAPGDMPMILPPGYAKKVPKGAKLVLQMHYTANGKAARDRSSVGLIFAKEPPRYEVLSLPVLNHAIRIPPGADHYEATASYHVRNATTSLVSFMPHMHLRGKDVRCEIIYPDERKETVLWIPRYNFNWQSAYRLEKPLRLPANSKVCGPLTSTTRRITPITPTRRRRSAGATRRGKK
jgi:peroxiredoxin/mono/diheme cytochrome c family protein